MLVLKNINKKFNDVMVLKNLNMEIDGGLNFIVGPSGSGKSTLLKIISGMDNEYEGEVFYRGKSLKDLNSNELNEYYYNSVGFIWQNFQLINHLSVEDNIKVILDLENISNEEKNKKVENILKRLSMQNLAKKNVSTLSGGQKQRVAIARALVKDPEIIIADEPTGALDKKTSNIIMNALAKIAKERTVIVVTHDKSLVNDDSNCFLLKDGVITQLNDERKGKRSQEKSVKIKPYLGLGRALVQGIRNFKGLFLKFILTALILVLSSYFLLLNVSGTVVNEQETILNNLIEEKGDALRDINLFSSAISAGGTTENGEEQEKQAEVNIEQNVSKALEKYKDDPRIEHVVPLDIIGNMNITINNVIKEYKVENTNNAPSINAIVEGRLPKQEGREVAVTKLFLERINSKAEDILGKTISISGEVYDWTSGEPELVKVEVKDLKIVGVVDSSIYYETPYGEKVGIELEDSFIYGLDVAKEIRSQSNKSTENISFTIRVKDIKDVMTIVNELSKQGLTPMGHFETVKDILQINSTTKEQSGSLTVIMAIIAIAVTLSVTIINGYLRKTEFAILKINGYSKASIVNLNIMEYLLIAIVSSAILVALLPLINNVSKSMLDMAVSGLSATMLGVGIVLIQGLIMGIISAIINSNIKIKNNLITGDR